MIVDALSNCERYYFLSEKFPRAFTFLRQTDLTTLKEDRYEIDGENIFAIVAKEQGREKDAAHLEIHNKYIDIQLVVSGIDEMGWKARSACTKIATPYNKEEDIQFYADTPSTWISTPPGHFAIFFPEDAHLPLISATVLHKVVVKVAV